MAKRPATVKSTAKGTKGGTKIVQLAELSSKGFLFVDNFRVQAIIVAALSVLFYINTRTNEYALDDDIVMRQNMYVQKGFGGIGEILSKDAYKSFYESMGVEQQLAGGRYRPLSIVSFAIEQQLFGITEGARFEEVRDSLREMQKKGISDIDSQSRLIGEKNSLELAIKNSNLKIAPIRHIMQVLWFALSMIVILRFLRNHIFRSNTDIAFLATLLFVIHPIHTEVVANVKSRDEIFSLLFIVLTLDYFFRYDVSGKRRDILWGMACFLLAFLSKEYALMLFILIPAGLMIFHKRKLNDMWKFAAPFGLVLFTYAMIRLGVGGIKGGSGPVDKNSLDPLNEPYMFANTAERITSKINRLDDYVWLLIFPYPLAADYSYQHFPYSNLGDPMVYLSLAVMAFMVWGTWKLWKKRHALAFALLFFFSFFMLINNIVFEVGATMGERLIYHSSLGFCMLAAWGLIWLADKAGQSAKYVTTGVFVLISIPALMLTMQRNLEWKNDETLFIADVQKHPNSALCNGNAGARFMDRGLKYLVGDSANQDSVHFYADTAIIYLQKSVELHPRYANGWLNLGLCYYNKKDYAKATDAWEKVYSIFPSNPILQSYAQMLVAHANDRAVRKQYDSASVFYNYALRAYPADSKIWADYAGSSYMAQKYDEAQHAFDMAYQKTNDEKVKANLLQGYRAAHYNDSAKTLWLSDSSNADYNMMVVQGIIGSPDFHPQARRMLEKVLVIRPGDAKATRLLDSLGTLEKKALPPPPPPVKDSLK